jgi:methionine synthase II (cobalamin-independent)
VQLSESAGRGTIDFGPLGYARAARASYADFARLQQEGIVPASVRFQVSLPTPFAVVNAFVARPDREAVEPAYERRLLAELDEMLETIPHQALAIQWDVAIEVGVLEGVIPSLLQRPEEEILERLVRLAGRVPEDVELGFHLCYGDLGHRHFKEPEDTATLVALANALSERIERPIAWIHLPVPRDRSDDAYFTPLRALRLHPETQLYLGLVHYTDGDEGTRRRIAAAQRTVPRFGVATECGMGRRPPETIPDLLAIHAAVAAPVSGGERR